MKIEKLSDTQIRCTLNQADLSSRELKISELAYGTEKAKSLFKDMMQQASYEFGFEAEDIPLMIEAIPVSTDCIVLVITKVEDPEELDTRFSKFSPSIDEDDSSYDDMFEDSFSSDEVMDLFNKLKEEDFEEQNHEHAADAGARHSGDSFEHFDNRFPSFSDTKKSDEDYYTSSVIYKMFSFDSIETVCMASQTLNSVYDGRNSLYKNTSNSRFYLLLTDENSKKADFNKICTFLSDFGTKERYSSASEAFLAEHCTLIIKDNAVSVMADL